MKTIQELLGKQYLEPKQLVCKRCNTEKKNSIVLKNPATKEAIKQLLSVLKLMGIDKFSSFAYDKNFQTNVKSERADLIRQFTEGINAEREGTKWKPNDFRV